LTRRSIKLTFQLRTIEPQVAKIFTNPYRFQFKTVRETRKKKKKFYYDTQLKNIFKKIINENEKKKSVHETNEFNSTVYIISNFNFGKFFAA